MPDAATSSSAAAPRPASNSLKANYLLGYNAVSMFSWLSLLWHAGLTLKVWGLEYVHPQVDIFWKVTQSLAVLEIVHSAFGIVRSPFMTTLMQVASRFLVVWGTVTPFPQVAKSPVFISLLVAHGVTEVIRYGYFAMALSGETIEFLGWLRYNTFIVLYPLGIASECWLMYLAIPYANEVSELWGYFYYAMLAIYVPGTYVLYSYMMKQRRKAMRGKAVEKKTQ
ncbi:hypothetical protein VC83_05663 [Pseudogymnoascus destructans]|uniref:Very-long-chain (3R)-3-hydroxyacyl-CoA dehydratase n=2 Tax=Pseudogymnoascus destructans TaxID=655981 RepID=L8G0Y7_PSED2|nr:uncharacterized protein VC83_05663 [Pseudogymnoascus destructans]ELR06945.1 hypothetical protein GMDG_08179 [Pseudogymnoascus destructans 20631-21]OAF57815.1 hypothetical protein VC83_05663 [Pseudogymnoascus destructans]